MLLKNPVTPPGIDPWTARLVAQRLNHYYPGPKVRENGQENSRGILFVLIARPHIKTKDLLF
jgi:hypothetical protein